VDVDDREQQQQAAAWLREELSARNAEIRETERAQQQQTLLVLFAAGGVAAFLTSGLFAKTGEYSAAVLFAVALLLSALGHRAIYYADFLTLQSRYIVGDLSKRIEAATGRPGHELCGWEHYFNTGYTSRAATTAMVGDFLLYALPQAAAFACGMYAWSAIVPLGSLARVLTWVSLVLMSASMIWSAVRAVQSLQRRRRVTLLVREEVARGRRKPR
jgi:hypothetical protein